MIESLIALLVTILIVGLIAGLVIFLVRRAPFIPADFKAWAEYLVIAIAVLVIIVRALPLVGVSV
jgi:fructose-specific phosphotransferase system IIC component